MIRRGSKAQDRPPQPCETGSSPTLGRPYFSDPSTLLMEGEPLYAGGDFRLSATSWPNLVIRWDGCTWHPVGDVPIINNLIRTHYPRDRAGGGAIMEQEAGIEPDGEFPVHVPLFMKEICEQVTIEARKSDYIDRKSGMSARFSIANFRTMVASARRRAAVLGERPAVLVSGRRCRGSATWDICTRRAAASWSWT